MPRKRHPRSQFTREMHPLLLPEVIYKMVEVCDPKQLKDIRLVCKLWYNASLTRFRQETSAIIKVGSSTKAGIGVGQLLEHLGNPEDPFNFQRRPLQHITLIINNWDEDQPISFQWRLTSLLINSSTKLKSIKMKRNIPAVNVNSFLRTVLKCPDLKHLHFTIYIRESVERFPINILPSESIHPNITRLKISLDDLGLCRAYLSSVFEWKNLFSRVPQLKELSLAQGPSRFRDMVEVFVDILDAIEEIRQTNKKVLNIHDLNIGRTFLNVIVPMPYHHDLITKLINLQLPLKSFIVDVAWAKVIPLFAPILQACGDTLKVFQTSLVASSVHHKTKDFSTLFPPGLTHLRIPFKSLNFLESTPNLKTLELVVKDFGKTIYGRTRNFDGILKKRVQINLRLDRRVTGNCCLAHLTKLFLSSYYEVAPKVLTTLAGWTPNLRYLTMNLTNKTFRIVCRNWKDLRFLGIHICHVNTEGFTGIVGNAPRLSNITDLKYLHTVDIWVLKVKIWDMAFTHGFLELGFLSMFKIHKPGKTVVCDGAILQLLEKKVVKFECKLDQNKL